MTEKIERLIATADEFELVAINFLDKNGAIAGNKTDWIQTEITFRNGSIFLISADEYKSLSDYKFKLGGQNNQH